MTETVKPEGPAGFLACLPALIGYRPRNSIVVAVFRGNRTIGAMRLDLQALVEQPELLRRYLGNMPQVDGVAVIGYVDGDDEVAQAAVVIQAQEFVLPELTMRGQFLVRGDECWLDLDLPEWDADGNPWRPFSEITSSPLWEHSAPVWHREVDSLDEPTPVDSDLVRELLADIPGLRGLRLALTADKHEVTAERVAHFIDASLDGGTHGRTGLMAELLGLDPTNLTHEQRIAIGTGEFAGPVDPDLVSAGQQIAVSATDIVPHPGVLVMAAWAHWAAGRGSQAGKLLDLAEREEPGRRDTAAFSAMVNAGHLPAWATAGGR